jgi:lipopolysaccharide/colanic/teichoic acid biosynthesis glycosyltransferase
VIDRKRVFDLACCVIAAPFAAVVGGLVAVLVRTTSGPPVLYRGRRMGQHGQEFDIIKFRTMTPAGDGPKVTAANDLRITPVGRWLRRTKLDELPQLINVLQGDMSVVGPRPEDPRYADHYCGRFADVLSVRPGITGPAAVQYRHEEALLGAVDEAEVDAHYVAAVLLAKLEIDLAYVRRHGLRTDLTILAATAKAVLARSTSQER